MDAVDGKSYIFGDVTGAQKISVEGVNCAVIINRMHGSPRGLSHDLTAKYSPVGLPLAGSGKNVFFRPCPRRRQGQSTQHALYGVLGFV